MPCSAGGGTSGQHDSRCSRQGGSTLNNEVVATLDERVSAHPASPGEIGRSRQSLIEIEDLNVQFVTSHGTVRAVEGLSYSVYPGEMVAIVGESGSGKSVSALATMRLLPTGNARIQGNIRFDGRELLNISAEEMRQL